MVKFKPPNPPMIKARHYGGAQKPTLIVMHSTVGPSTPGQAKAIAEWWNGPTSPVTSAHYVVDAGGVYQCVPDHNEAYHCGYNHNSIGVEMCDYPSASSKKRWDDKEHVAVLHHAAHLVAQLCLAYDIRPYGLNSVSALLKWNKGQTTGITTHNLMSQAFHKSTHWDPGAWRRLQFMRLVRKKYKKLKKAGS